MVMKIFTPSIAARTSAELIQIVAVPENWDNEAVLQAKKELSMRGVDFQGLAEKAKHFYNRKENLQQLRRAKEAYSIADFIFSPIWTLLEILISWELKKDGYLRKARQQKIFRAIILVIMVSIFLFCFFSNL
jgi:hypothetical protein